MNIASVRSHAAAFIEALRDVGLLVGDRITPSGVTYTSQGQLTVGYCVVYDQSSGITSGPMSAPNDDEDFIYNVHCLGPTADVARGVTDKVRAEVLGGNFTIPGRRLLRTPSLDTAVMLNRDDDTAEPPLFGYALVARVATTPA